MATLRPCVLTGRLSPSPNTPLLGGGERSPAFDGGGEMHSFEYTIDRLLMRLMVIFRDRLLELAMDRHFVAHFEMGVPAIPPPCVAQLFAGLDSHVNAYVKAARRRLMEHVEKLEREMQWLREDHEKFRTAFEGECIVTMRCNKTIVAHMKDVNG
ncbi:hypothetical protein CJ030_MR5G022574 [Morella rubra]|uniref:Uncharacterized protein n=1 Tax=Morella rubra TaxID=262757 RepID=A0A6A1VL01_9ROSI|nr:hypothetical protein CJ030_MR5G022574 [Morella rubra]